MKFDISRTTDTDYLISYYNAKADYWSKFSIGKKVENHFRSLSKRLSIEKQKSNFILNEKTAKDANEGKAIEGSA